VLLYEEIERQEPQDQGTAKLRFTLGQREPSPIVAEEEEVGN
jgi:hypothetical protein